MRDRALYHLAGGMVLIGASAATAACDGDGATGGSGGSAAGAAGATSAGAAGSAGTAGSSGAPALPFQPVGCDFKVAPRPESSGWSAGKSDVGATPNIRRVRLGLGGNVAIGAKGRADPSTSIGFAWQSDDGTLATEVQWAP